MTNAVNLASAAGTGFAFRNRIINGGMAVDQRNAGASAALLNSLAYSTVDRFFTNASSSSGQYSAQRITATDGTNRLRITSPAGGTGIVLGQRIESLNSRDLAGNTVTVSLKLVSSSARDVTWTLFYANSTDVFTSVTQIATGTWAITTNEQLFSVTVSVPSAATTGLQLQISTATLSGGATLTTGDWQLEVGSVATPFERRLYGQEVALCQRYFCKSSSLNVIPVNGTLYSTAGMFFSSVAGAYLTTAAYTPFMKFPVTMRTEPATITTYNTSLPSPSTAGQWSIFSPSGGVWYNCSVSAQSVTQEGWGAALAGSWGSTGALPLYGAWAASAEL